MTKTTDIVYKNSINIYFFLEDIVYKLIKIMSSNCGYATFTCIVISMDDFHIVPISILFDELGLVIQRKLLEVCGHP